MTQSQLAEALGYSTNSLVSFLERGEREPTIETVVRVALLFKVSVDWLLGVSKSDVPEAMRTGRFVELVRQLRSVPRVAPLTPEMERELDRWEAIAAMVELREAGELDAVYRSLGQEPPTPPRKKPTSEMTDEEKDREIADLKRRIAEIEERQKPARGRKK